MKTLLKRRPVQAVIAVVAAVVLAFAGLGIASVSVSAAPAAVTAAAPGDLYGCITLPGRVIEHVYTTQAGFTGSGGCPSGSFPFTVVSGTTTTPTPTPTPTTPTPTPTPTMTTTSAACVTSANMGECGPYTFSNVSANNGSGNVIQDVWNPVNIKQTLTANSASSWSVSATATGTAVQSYPDTQQTMTTSSDLANPLAPDVNSTFAETVPANGDWESAYDVWLGSTTNSGAQYNQEIMIWTDNHGQTPAGSDTGKSAAIDGVTYEIWSEPGNSTVTLEADANKTSGSVDVTTAITDLQADGYVASGEGYSQIDYGYEICSTNGSPETFAVTGYTLSS